MSAQNTIVTIYIHGTLPPRAVLSIPVVNNFFYCKPGLNKAKELDQTYHTAQCANQLCSNDPEQFELEHFYLFGWNGKLRFDERKKTALELYNHILYLKKEYEKLRLTPLFKIITHSHGGNVALNLAPIVEEHPDQDLQIDELILLACPVQTETSAYVNESLFKKVFSIHSHHDLLQVLDPQGIHEITEKVKQHGLEFALKNVQRLGPLFSARHFTAGPTVFQTNVRYGNRELFHIEFLFSTPISALPAIIRKMKQLERKQIWENDDLTYILTSE